MTGHIKTPSANASPGQRYARHALRRHTSVPMIASPSRQSPSRRKPVANSQWTCSLGGCMFLLQVLEESRHDGEVEEQPHRDHEQRRLDEEPPEALTTWMQQGDAIRLNERPDDASEHRRRTERGDDSRTRGRA